MIITIQGVQGEGKTTLAREIMKDKNALFIEYSDIKNKEWLLEINESIQFLVVDDVQDIEETKLYLAKNTFSVRKPYAEKMTKVKLPESIILIAQLNSENGTNSTNSMRYKFRAECELDFRNLLSRLNENLKYSISRLEGDVHGIPDIEVEIEMQGTTLAQLRGIMRNVEDGHVMLQTVQPVEKYTGGRDFSIR